MERYSRDTVVVTTAEINELAANKALDPTVEYWVDRNRFAYAPDRETIKYLVDGDGNSTPSERVAVTASRALTAADHGKILEIQNAGLTLTTAFNTLPSTFFCVYSLQSGTTSFVFTGGATCNGAATTITRAVSANKFVGFASRATANAFDMDGV